MKQRNDKNQRNHDNAIAGMEMAITHKTNQPRKLRFREHDDGNAAFNQPHDTLSTGLQEQFDQHNKDQK